MQSAEQAKSGPPAVLGPIPSIPVKLAYSLGQAAQNGGFDAAIAFIFFYYSVFSQSSREFLPWRHCRDGKAKYFRVDEFDKKFS